MTTWNTLFLKKCLHVGPKLVYDAADMVKVLTCGTLENFMTTWNTLLSKNAYMWDPTKFYDDLECSIFKIMLTCGTKVGL
jgi:hypothetical protein